MEEIISYCVPSKTTYMSVRAKIENKAPTLTVAFSSTTLGKLWGFSIK